jgi:hypothetical protein
MKSKEKYKIDLNFIDIYIRNIMGDRSQNNNSLSIP